MNITNNLTQIDGDLFDVKGGFICHQCNCVSHGTAGLAASIVQKWPHTNPAADKDNRRLGRVSFFAAGNNMVVNMYAQRNPGKATEPDDTGHARLGAFVSCLKQVAETYIHGYDAIYLPHGIGCGLAGGDWDDYFCAITAVAIKYPHKKFVIVKKNA